VIDYQRGAPRPPRFGFRGLEADRPFHAPRMIVGGLPALAGHLLTLHIIVDTGGLETPQAWLYSAFRIQATMYILCLIFAVVELFRGDRGLLLGFVLAWALGMVTLLLLGCGAYGYAVADG
jgi:hypothetical protein